MIPLLHFNGYLLGDYRIIYWEWYTSFLCVHCVGNYLESFPNIFSLFIVYTYVATMHKVRSILLSLAPLKL